MQQSETIGKLSEALSKVQAVLEGAKLDSENPFFKSKYSDLTSVWSACRKPLAENGLSVIQTCQSETADMVIVETMLCHTSGEWVRGRLAMRPVKADPQGVGSCITYARRYSLAAIVGVAPEDDDGNVASGHSKQTEGAKMASKPFEKPSQQRSAPVTDTNKEPKTVKEKLEKKMWDYLKNLHSDSDDNFKTLLIDLTSFEGKDGKTVYVDNFDKLSEKWAGSCMGKMEALIDEEERKAAADMKDVPY
jgi:hypothetical protein